MGLYANFKLLYKLVIMQLRLMAHRLRDILVHFFFSKITGLSGCAVPVSKCVNGLGFNLDLALSDISFCYRLDLG